MNKFSRNTLIMDIDSERGQDAEICNTQRITTTAGYIPKATQLQILLNSGKALDDYRRSMFPEFEPENAPTEPEYDPTSRKDYDIFDAHEDVKIIRGRAYARRETIAQHQANEAAKAAELAKNAEKPAAGETPPPVAVPST